MKGVLLFIVLVGSCAASVLGPMERLHEVPVDFDSEERVDPPDLMEVGRMIMTAMQTLLANQERTLDVRLKQLELYVDHTCGNPSAAGQTQQKSKEDLQSEVSQMLEGFGNYMSSMAQVFIDELQQQFDAKIELAMKKMDEKLTDISVPAKIGISENRRSTTVPSIITSPGLSDVTLSAISRAVQNQVKNLASRSDLQKQKEYLEEQFSITNSLSNESLDTKILNYTKDIHNILYSFKPVYETFRKVVNNCDVKEDQFYQMERFELLLQELKVEVDDNGNVLSNMFQAIEGAEDLLGEKLTAIENLTHQLYNKNGKLPTTLDTTAGSLPEGTASNE